MVKDKYQSVKKDNSICLQNSSGEILHEIEEFLGSTLPECLKEGLGGQSLLKKAVQNQIMENIDFTPPFLRIEKIVIYGDKNNILDSHSLAMGILTPMDTKGHYNNTIFLADCGCLMGQSASAHLALLFPNTAPQVIKVNQIISVDRHLWKPNRSGSTFLVKTDILKKRLRVVQVTSRISLGNFIYGIANDATIVLTPRESIYSAKELSY